MKVVRKMAVFVAALAGLAACATQTPEHVPDPPNLDSLVAQFQAPSAPLDQDSALEVVTDLFDTVELVSGTNKLGPLKDMVDLLGAAQKAEEEEQEKKRAALTVAPGLETSRQAADVGGEDVTGEGFFRITRICNGWGDDPPIDEDKNGVIQLTAVFSDKGFDPVVWGEFVDCRYQAEAADAADAADEPKELFLDGEISIHTGDLLSGVDTFALDYVIEFDGKIELDGEPFEGDLGLRLLDGGRMEVNLEVEQGNLVYFTEQESEEQTTQGFRASNGEWNCDFAAGQCVSEEDGTTIAF